MTHLASATPIALPSLGDPLSGLISKDQEHDLGRQWLRQLRRTTAIMDDPDASQWLQHIIYTLFPHANLQGTQLSVVLLERPELNAFAVPGGIIGINLGLLLYAQDEDELAAVLAHELAHLSQRHFVRQVEKAQKDIPMTMAAMFASALILANQDTQAGVAGIYSAYGALLQNRLRYSRELEQEADRIGFGTLQRAGFDPYAMSSMFKRMQFSQRFGQKPPEFLLTHPMTQQRISDSAQRAKAHTPRTRKASLEFWWFKHNAYIKYNQIKKPLDYAQDQKRHSNPTSAKYTALSLIEAHSFIAQGQLIQAQKHLKRIDQHWKQNALFIQTQARLLMKQNAFKQAIKLLEKNIALYPGTISLQSTLVSALIQDNDTAKALITAQQMVNTSQHLPVSWQRLSQSAEQAKQWPLAHYAKAELLWLNGYSEKAAEQWRRGLELADENNDMALSAKIKQRLAQTRGA